MSEYKYDIGEVVELRGWTIRTKINGEITVAQDDMHGWYILNVDGVDVAG